MADAETISRLHGSQINNSQRKRKRLKAVLDKLSNHITTHVTSKSNQNHIQSSEEKPRLRQTERRTRELQEKRIKEMLGRNSEKASNEQQSRIKNNATIRREMWRDTQQREIEDQKDVLTKEVYCYPAPSSSTPPISECSLVNVSRSRDDDSSANKPVRSGSQFPHADSPRICFSPLRIKDSIEEEEETGTEKNDIQDDSVTVVENILPNIVLIRRNCDRVIAKLNPREITNQILNLASTAAAPPEVVEKSSATNFSTSTTPSLQALCHLPSYISEAIRRRCLSDRDLSCSTLDANDDPTRKQRTIKLNSLEKAQIHHIETFDQEIPLDLSLKYGSSVSSTTGYESGSSRMNSIGSSTGSDTSEFNPGRTRSCSDHSLETYLSIDNAAAITNDDITVSCCPICGLIYSNTDLLVQHMDSNHKSQTFELSNSIVSLSTNSAVQQLPATASKTYLCDICNRSFARSDMLTRHMRLHTGMKPYTCRICHQVFSRSDHLSTHQRTHTGEKPYRCPNCPYAACRRDMITRHMRTHTRYELYDSKSLEEQQTEAGKLYAAEKVKSLPCKSKSLSTESSNATQKNIHESTECIEKSSIKTESGIKPPSPMDTTEPSLNPV